MKRILLLATAFVMVLSLSLPAFSNVNLAGSWLAGTSHAKEDANDRALIFIAHSAYTGFTSPMNMNSVTYGGQQMTKVMERNFTEDDFAGRAYVVAYILNEAGIAAATDNNFAPTWVSTPSSVKYSSVFLKNVSQMTLVGDKDSNGTIASTVVVTQPLDTNNGDMAILAASCGKSGSYTLGSGFTEGTDQSISSKLTGVTGHKATTGVAEIPKATFSTTVNRQVIIGFVVQAIPDMNKASSPSPVNGEANVDVQPILRWAPGEGATSHDVYFGTDPNAHNNPKYTVDTNSYDPPGNLEYGVKYYWAVDANKAGTIHPGSDWWFTTVRKVDPNYVTGTWRGFRTAAISYTFDDGTSNQLPIAIPIFDEFDFKATLYPVINWGPNWNGLRSAVANGHEVGSHTVSHSSLGSLPLDGQMLEMMNSQIAIEANIPDQRCVTLAYPNCSIPDETLCARYYIAGRVCDSRLEANTPANFYQISSFICGSGGSVQTPEDFNTRCANAAAAGGWCTFLIHGVDGDGGYSPLASTTLRSSLEYLDARRNIFWVETFGNVARYIRERNGVTILETSNQGTCINLRVSHVLDNAIFNYPITIRRPLPQGWTSVNVSQNGQVVDACVADIDSIKYVTFDVMPNGGNVVLSGIYGDFKANCTVEMNDLSEFLNFWLKNDCNETNGVDLDENCIVNFYEFSVLAENWLKTP